MRVHLQSHSHVSLQRLFLAFPLTVAPTQGRSVIRRRGHERLLVPGQAVTIEPFEAIDMHLDGSCAQPSACTVEIRHGMPGTAQDGLHHRISRRVFLQPQYAWSAGFIAERLDMPAAQLRRLLFSQGTALTDLCRTQRLMRLLFEAMSADVAMGDLKRFVGWPPAGDVESAFYDRFGVSMQTARRLASQPARELRRSIA
ncbi:AraC family transcriptional regulator [Cupriavidus sp. WKF15]|uniref:AraC family transcriptional regulator n=1 Tax=Cupriavidus sp. WKF15 TaxID=3032282 RepID=UPI0023E104FB|nr:AraC family transcriptional regulator [Cupriavidus sp. WKF15]WER49085.1 AraC family transcriptional regulator [Cupriavidus sp. WKF15]